MCFSLGKGGPTSYSPDCCLHRSAFAVRDQGMTLTRTSRRMVLALLSSGQIQVAVPWLVPTYVPQVGSTTAMCTSGKSCERHYTPFSSGPCPRNHARSYNSRGRWSVRPNQFTVVWSAGASGTEAHAGGSDAGQCDLEPLPPLKNRYFAIRHGQSVANM